MFGRSKSEDQPTEADAYTASQQARAARTEGKGRPTPTRKEAEAAARARAKVPRSRKEEMAQQRLARSESSGKVRAAMKSGDERYLLARDKGPLRRFVRDYVDTRFSVLELVIPLLLVGTVLGYIGPPGLSQAILLATLLFLIVAGVQLRYRLRREVAVRFPESSTKGLTYYSLSRASQPRFLRMPKAQLRRGEELPRHYR